VAFGSPYHQIFVALIEIIVQSRSKPYFNDIQIVLWRELFDLSNSDFGRDMCIDCLAFLFNNNSNCKQYYLDQIKDIIQALSLNIFLSPKELRLSDLSAGQEDLDAVEWMIVERIIRPFLQKIEISDLSTIVNMNCEGISDERLAQAAILPTSLLLAKTHLETIFGSTKDLINMCVKKLANDNTALNEPIQIAYVIALKNTFATKGIGQNQGKQVLTYVLYNRAGQTLSDRYAEEAILASCQIIRKFDNTPGYISMLVELINCIRQYYWCKTDRVKMAICYLIDSYSDKFDNTVTGEFLKCLQQFFAVAFQTQCNETLQAMLCHSIINIISMNAASKDTLTSCLPSNLRDAILSIIDTITEGEEVKGSSVLSEESLIAVQQQKLQNSMQRKKEIVAFNSSVQKVKPKIKSIPSVSIVDQVIEIKKSLSDLASGSQSDQAIVVQQLEPHLKEITNIYNTLCK